MDKHEAVEILKELPERIAAVIMPSDRFFDYKEALEFAVSHLEADRWISVEERMPEEDGEYLVNVGSCYGYIFDVGDIDIYAFKEGKFQTDTSAGITHWRPLPKAPESEANNEQD